MSTLSRNGTPYAGGIAGDDRARWHVARHDAARADNRAFADGDAAEQHCAGANRGAAADDGRLAFPVGFRLKLTGCGRARETVVDEGDVVTNEYFVLNRDAFADEGVARDLAPATDLRALLDFDERAHFGTVAKLGRGVQSCSCTSRPSLTSGAMS